MKIKYNLVLDGGSRETKEIINLTTFSVQFRKFIIECKAQIEQVYKLNLVLTTELIIKLLRLLSKEISVAEII